MALSWRIWLLGIALAISVVSIITGEAYVKVLVLAALIGMLFVLSFLKSLPGKIFLSALFLAVAIVLIYNSVGAGVLVKSVNQDSIIFEQGLRKGEVITALNGQKINSIENYSSLMDSLFISEENIRLDITTKTAEYTVFTNQTPQITVGELPKTSIKTGLDISGGARALVQTDQPITDEELQDLIAVSRNRFNVFGLSDVSIKGVTDLSGNKFMLIEVAGATPADLEELVSQQGKFEAKIGNTVVFTGGDEDITNVCRNDATCASVTGCFPQEGGYFCNFAFTITLSPEAAKRHADVTRNIPLDPSSGNQYLTENLTLILDENVVDELRISAGLKGQLTSQISIQGSGQGATQEQAIADARASMNHLQTILITGSLPFKLEIVKIDSISPALGNQFVYLMIIAGISAILVVGLVIFIRYRNIKSSFALLFTSFSELGIILGIASLIGWNLDLPSLAGILATIGTGVDQQIVILDEARSGKHSSMKQRLKRALFVVVAAYFTALASLLPLYWAGAGLFKGFAFTTIIGITAGVLITRPAFADMIKKIEE